MSSFLDPNDPHYSDTPDVSLHPLEGEKNVHPIDRRDEWNLHVAANEGKNPQPPDLRPYIDMIDPADPPSPLDGFADVVALRTALLHMAMRRHEHSDECDECLIVQQQVQAALASSPAPAPAPADPPSPLTARRAIARAIADSRKAFGVLRPDDLMDALERDGFMVVPLASSPAPAGLDALRFIDYLWTAEGKIDGRSIAMGELFDDDDPILADFERFRAEARAATRPAEDAEA